MGKSDKSSPEVGRTPVADAAGNVVYEHTILLRQREAAAHPRTTSDPSTTDALLRVKRERVAHDGHAQAPNPALGFLRT